MSLDKLRQELREFKSSLLELSMDRSMQEDELIKLVNSTSSKDNLIEVLILMYSNSKSDVQSMKSFQIKTLIELVDKLEASIVSYNDQLLAINNKVDNHNKDINYRLDVIDETIDTKLKSSFFNTWYGRILFIVFIGIFILIVFFGLYRIDPDSAKFSSDVFGKLFDKTIDTSTAVTNPVGGK